MEGKACYKIRKLYLIRRTPVGKILKALNTLFLVSQMFIKQVSERITSERFC